MSRNGNGNGGGANIPATAFRLARREMRGGLKGFRIFLACLALGVAAIAAIGSLSSAVRQGLEEDAQAILGGDASFRMIHREAPADALAHLRASGTVSHVTEMRTMSYRATPREGAGPDRVLVELKAVDDAYPLFGEVRHSGEGALHNDMLAGKGALADPLLLQRLGLEIGDRLRVGRTEVVIRGTLEREPDRDMGLINLGPRLLISRATLAETGLVVRGSLVYHRYRIRLADGIRAGPWIDETREAFPDAGWRIRSAARPAPGLDRFLDQITLYLTMVGLTALLVGGLGVAGGVRTYLERKTASIATMKCVGAPAQLVFLTYLFQILILAGLGILIGLVIGAGVPILLAPAVEELLRVSLRLDLYPLPLALAAAYGLLTALAFSLWSLAQAREVPPGALFRSVVSAPDIPPRRVFQLLTALVALCLAGLAIVTAADKLVAAIFVAGAVAAFFLFRGAGWLIQKGAARISAGGIRNPNLRLALANLHRPGAATSSVVLSLGLGVTVLVAVALIQGNIVGEVSRQLPRNAPTYFFVDIQPHQVETFDATIREIAGEDANLTRMPMIRGRIARIKGVPADEAEVTGDGRWAVRGERGISFATVVPENNRIVSGEWWPADYSGPPLVSLYSDFAEGLNVSVGDTITMNIVGREITGTIANFRDIQWRTMGLNFTVIFSPGLIEQAPHMYIATVNVPESEELPLLNAVTDRLPNVTPIHVRGALQSVSEVLDKIATTVQAVALITILAGTLVLAGAIAAGHRRRVYNAVVLKVLGATRGRVTRTFLLEYGILGAATAAVAAVMGSVIAYFVLTYAMRAEFTLLPGAVLITALACTALTVLFGYAGTWRALGQKPAAMLRNE